MSKLADVRRAARKWRRSGEVHRRDRAELLEVMRAAAADGDTQSAIARELGVSRQLVWVMLRENGGER